MIKAGSQIVEDFQWLETVETVVTLGMGYLTCAFRTVPEVS